MPLTSVTVAVFDGGGRRGRRRGRRRWRRRGPDHHGLRRRLHEDRLRRRGRLAGIEGGASAIGTRQSVPRAFRPSAVFSPQAARAKARSVARTIRRSFIRDSWVIRDRDRGYLSPMRALRRLLPYLRRHAAAYWVGFLCPAGLQFLRDARSALPPARNRRPGHRWSRRGHGCRHGRPLGRRSGLGQRRPALRHATPTQWRVPRGRDRPAQRPLPPTDGALRARSTSASRSAT